MQSTSIAVAAEPTRLLLSNLHPSVAAHHLREHLQACPPAVPGLTDLKVLSRPDGSSRCLAFAGFKSHDDADRVKRWASGAWVSGDRGGARVKVEWAKDTRDAPRPAKRLKRADAGATPGGAPSQDDRFAEFMAVMAPARTYTGAAAPERLQAQAAPAQQAEQAEQAELKPARDPPRTALTASAPALPPHAVPATPAVDDDDGAAQDDALTDADYLARRMKRRLVDSDADLDEQSQEQLWVQEDGGARSSAVPEERGAALLHASEPLPPPVLAASSTEPPAHETILDTGRLFVRNLPFSATQDDLEQLFGQYGAVAQVHVPVDRRTTAQKGLAYISFARASDAVAAYDALDGTTFQGRLLHVLPAIGRGDRSGGSERPSTLKEDRLERRKQSAGQSFSWGALYLNTDAALSAVAERLGIAKSALLDPSASDPAVKVALAEAHTLAETKRYFEDENVNVEAFSQPGARSSTCILVKNLPFATTASSLHALFSPHGTVRRLLIPPSGLIAIVEMEDAASAAAAWRALVYKQFGGSVLYLEKAPASIFASDTGSKLTSGESTASSIPAVTSTPLAAGAAHPSTDDTEAAAATLFVKNLSFATTAPRLKAAFDGFPDVIFARVQTKPDPVQPSRTLSMGFGFVGFRTAAAAANAKNARQGYVLDGHALEVRFAQRNADKHASDARPARTTETSTKLLVKNVPFEATRADLRQLFGTYGTLKSVRLPRKMDNKTRGFAFLEFATRRDAEAAFAALEHTHLLGRHLVLQWAGGEEDEAESGQSSANVIVGGKSRRVAKTKFAM